MRKVICLVVVAGIVSLCGYRVSTQGQKPALPAAAAADLPLNLIKMAPGFRIELYTRFAEGWLRGMKPAAAGGGAMVGDVWGRPADVLVMRDGALLVSDDKAGVIYRISYQKP